MKKLLLLLISLVPAYAGIDTLAQWDIRTTGADTNGGCFAVGVSNPGTDYSVADSPHVTFNGTSITATTAGTSAVMTLTGYTVLASDVGNCLQITGGVNFTVGVYYISSVNTGLNQWTMSGSVSSGAGTAMAGAMGGGFATIAKALTYSFGAGGSGTDPSNVIWIKNGTYTLTTALLDTTNSGSSNAMGYEGYNTTHGDHPTGTNRPLITTSTNSTPLLRLPSYRTVRYIRFSNTAATRSSCIYSTGDPTQFVFYGNKFTGCSIGINADYTQTGGGSTMFNVTAINNEFEDNTLYGIISDGAALVIGNTFHGIGTTATHSAISFGSDRGNTIHLAMNNAFYNNQHCIQLNNSNAGHGVHIINNSCNSAVDSGMPMSGVINATSVIGNIWYAGGTWGINTSGAGGSTGANAANLFNSYGANGTAPVNGWPTDTTDITLSATPFTSTTDLTLDNTAGGGALLKGIVGSLPLYTGYTDGGALQSNSGAAGTSANSSYVQ